MKCALVTGSTKGIGRAIAEKLLEEGWFVIVNYAKDDDSAAEFARINARFADRFTILKQELSSWEASQSFIAGVKAITDHLECLVFNAGATDRSPFDEIRHQDWEYCINTNISVPVYVIQGLKPLIRPGMGRIIFMGSVCGILPHAGSLAYGVTKAAIHQMAKDLVKVFAPDGITVNAIAPGFTDTPWQKSKAPDHRKRIEDKIALGRFAEPSEIASLCLEVINNQYINGAVLSIDGGYSYR